MAIISQNRKRKGLVMLQVTICHLIKVHSVPLGINPANHIVMHTATP